MVDDLLESGIRHFLDAQYALNRFQAEVGAISESLLKQNIRTVAAVLKIKAPSPEKIYVAYWPGGPDPKYDGVTAWVGAELWLESPITSTLFLGLSFQRGDKNNSIVKAAIGFTPQTKRLYLLLKSAFSKSENDLYDDPEEKAIGFMVPIAPGDAIDKELRRTLENFIAYCKQAGGWGRIVSP